MSIQKEIKEMVKLTKHNVMLENYLIACKSENEASAVESRLEQNDNRIAELERRILDALIAEASKAQREHLVAIKGNRRMQIAYFKEVAARY